MIRQTLRRAAIGLLGLGLSATSAVTLAPQAHAAYSEYKGPNPTNRVTLTFDDCPKSMTQFRETVLAAEALDIALVLFPTGNCISSGLIDVNYARAHGHYVFNHSVSHPDLTTLSYSGVQRQLGAPGVVTTYGRPPYGAINSTVRSAYSSVGMKPWLWNVDTNDWRGKSGSELISHVSANARAGDSVLMHMQWNGFNRTVLSGIKSGLAKRGIGVCRNYPGTTPVRPAELNCNGGSTPTPTPTRAFGDENGDGRADIVAIRTSEESYLYTTTSTNSLVTAGKRGFGWGTMNWAQRIPSIIGDSNPDLLARRTDGTLWVYTGKGNGWYTTGKQIASGWAGRNHLLVLPDVNGDGSPELVAADAEGYLQRYRLTSSGTTLAGRIGHGWRSNIRFMTTLGNTTGDATPDIVAVTDTGELRSYTMTRSGTILQTVKIGHGWQQFTSVHSPGDMNRDGRRDLVARKPDGTLHLYAWKGNGYFYPPKQIGHGWNTIRLFT